MCKGGILHTADKASHLNDFGCLHVVNILQLRGPQSSGVRRFRFNLSLTGIMEPGMFGVMAPQKAG
jgi:hypothetical protein